MRYDETYRLCYINRPWAYFTTQNLDDQWGDDWNDAPYEHNAGSPYTWDATRYDSASRQFVANDKPRWEIGMIAFDVNLATPCDEHFNSPYSVQGINQRQIAWLHPYKFDTGYNATRVEIWAGSTYPEFVHLINSAGGTVYEPILMEETETA